MQNIQERLTGLLPATGASSRRTARFAVSISASLTDLKKNHGFSARCPAFFFQKLNMSDIIEKIPPNDQQPFKRKWTGTIHKGGKSIQLK